MRCLSVLDLVILFYLFTFFLGRKAQKVLKRSVTYPLKGCRSLLEIWGCLGILFYLFTLKKVVWGVIFPLPTPLRGCRSLLEIVFCRTV